MQNHTTTSLIERCRKSKTGCLIWTGAKRNASGYGIVRHNGKRVYTHRLIMHLANELDIADSESLVLHHCDTPSCINKNHLYVGTKADNNADRIGRRTFTYQELEFE